MPTPVRIKRSTGSAAPASLNNAELAYSEGGGGTLFVGVGTGGEGGLATTVQAIGGNAWMNSALSSYLTTSSAASTYAPLASPALTGTPTAPTATAGTNTTQIATTAFVSSAVSALVNSAPEALNTLKELADALGSDASFSTTISTALGGKLAAASNLSDVASVSTARTNLGLGSMATQSASNVNITGGTIDGVTLDGGTY
mgnify:FL=1